MEIVNTLDHVMNISLSGILVETLWGHYSSVDFRAVDLQQ